jgi:hypothetical protein
MTRWASVGVLACVWSVGLLAQPTSPHATLVHINTAFTVKADHNGINTDTYRLRDNGSLLMESAKADVWAAGVVSMRLSSGLSTKGTHLLKVCAFQTSDSSEICSTAITVKVK